MSTLGGVGRAQESGAYEMTKIQLTGAEGGWDYITTDPDARHLFVASSGPHRTYRRESILTVCLRCLIKIAMYYEEGFSAGYA